MPTTFLTQKDIDEAFGGPEPQVTISVTNKPPTIFFSKTGNANEVFCTDPACPCAGWFRKAQRKAP